MENPSSPTAAQIFFEELKALAQTAPAEAFGRICPGARNTPAKPHESEWLDYKEAAYLGDPTYADDEKFRNAIRSDISEYVSAFSNTSGGLLIWGAKTTKAVPTKYSAVPDLSRFLGVCREILRDVAVHPFLASKCFPCQIQSGARAVYLFYMFRLVHTVPIGRCKLKTEPSSCGIRITVFPSQPRC